MRGNVFYFIFVMWHWSLERFNMSGDDTIEDLMATKFEKHVKIMQNQ
jgi:hypothetical protein